MIKLRKILLYNWPFYLLFFISLLFVLVKINCLSISNYTKDTKFMIGTLEECYVDGNKLTLILYGKEKVIGTYYFFSKNDLNSFQQNIFLGDQLKIIGEFSRANSNTTKNMFNYRKYLERNHIFYTIKINKIILLKKNSSFYYSVKNSIMKRFHDNPYLYTFILGNVSYIDDRVLQSYRSNGISHLFSISGMHVTLLSSVLFKILKKFSLSENYCYFLTSLFLISYLFLTGLSPSILRGILFFIFFSINKVYYFHIKSVNIFLLVLSMALFINPFYIYDVGFQYSFCISFSLLVLSNFIIRYKHYLSKLLITSFISFIVSVPITLYNFYEINLLSIFYNLFYVPFVSIIVFPLSIITFLFPIIEPIFQFFIYILESSSLYISHFDILQFIFMKIDFWFYILYYLFIILFFMGILYKKHLFLIPLFIVIVIHYVLPNFDTSSYLEVIDVGQGDSLLLHIRNKNILFDTGGNLGYTDEPWMKRRRNYSIVKNTTIPLLKSFGIKKIDYLILSHGDYDHMGEAINLVSNFKVEKVIFNCGEFNELEKELIKVLDKKKIKYYSCIKELNIDNNKLYFLQTKEYDNENDNSNVIYTELDGYKFMFMGDAGVEKEKDILNKYNISGIDVLKIGHHGSKTSSSKEFINSINPKYSLISVGKNNRYGHPKDSVLETLSNSKIYRTDIDGSIMFKIKNNKLEIETCTP